MSPCLAIKFFLHTGQMQLHLSPFATFIGVTYRHKSRDHAKGTSKDDVGILWTLGMVGQGMNYQRD